MAITKITVNDVEEWLGVTADSLNATLVSELIDAVYAHGTRHYTLDDAGDDTDDERDRALVMEVARLWQRKHSVNGFVGTDELAPVRVLMFDADVRRLLAGRLRTAGLFGGSATYTASLGA